MVRVHYVNKKSGTLGISIPWEICNLEGIKAGDRLHFNRPAKGRVEILKVVKL